MEYKNFNDYELVYQVRENDDVAYNAILEKYSHVLDMLTKRYLKINYNIGLEYDDLYQEGLYGLLSALNNYNSNDTLFFTYANLCIKREMERIIVAHKRNKQMVLNGAISINELISNDSDITLEDVIPSRSLLEDEYISKVNYNELVEFKYQLKFIDSLVYELKINSFSIAEIAQLLDLTYKSVDYRLGKIRKRLLIYIKA